MLILQELPEHSLLLALEKLRLLTKFSCPINVDTSLNLVVSHNLISFIAVKAMTTELLETLTSLMHT
jgi:hypothetical protein